MIPTYKIYNFQCGCRYIETFFLKKTGIVLVCPQHGLQLKTNGVTKWCQECGLKMALGTRSGNRIYCRECSVIKTAERNRQASRNVWAKKKKQKRKKKLSSDIIKSIETKKFLKNKKRALDVYYENIRQQHGWEKPVYEGI